jgi:FtsP/CotA-like multicopper oxidase with cupredoxin domain
MIPVPQPQASPDSALLMGLAERADVIVDFSGLPDGTVVRMVNTAPDAPFGGFPDIPADSATTGQVMEFTVKAALFGTNPNDGLTSSPLDMKPKEEKPLRRVDAIRQVSLNEGESELICFDILPDGSVAQAFDSTGMPLLPPDCVDPNDPLRGAAPFGPKEALLGTVDLTGAAPMGIPLKWTDTTGTSTAVPVQLQDGTTLMIDVTENPTVGDTEIWEIYNFTADGHPIHLHLVRFEVVNREVFDAAAGIPGTVRPPEAWETGFKDTVIAYPGEITRVKALFDIPGLYVWHCHIVEHEDNEMMRPYVVSP